MKTYTIILSCLLLIIPFTTFASDIDTGDIPPATFENLQKFSLQTRIGEDGPILGKDSDTTLPMNEPVDVNYSIDYTDWPQEHDSTKWTNMLHYNRYYLELWEGEPFTPNAHLLQNWDITWNSGGTVSVTFPHPGKYFFVSYFPDGYYKDAQSACPDDENWQEDCVPHYTLDEMRTYFDTPIDTPEFYTFTSAPLGFAATKFSVSEKSEVQTSNVLFLPGIEGSRLYMRTPSNREMGVWEPRVLNGVGNLAMNPDGTSVNAIYTRDIIDYISHQPVLGTLYGAFEKFMDESVLHGTIHAWTSYPYDWRYDVEDIIKNGTLVATATSTPTRIYLQDVLTQLASTSPNGKVTIVAHSNGGLLAKALAIELQKSGKDNLIDKIVLVGTPQFGTPETIGAMLHGDGQSDALGGLFIYGGSIRRAAQNMPGMYGLLPSPAYFSHEQNPVITFASTTVTNLYRAQFGDQIDSYDELIQFLTDSPGAGRLLRPELLGTPLALSSALLEKARATHALLDSWIPPANIELTAIAGWGQLAPYQYTYSSSNVQRPFCYRTGPLIGTCGYTYLMHHTPLLTENADNTVVDRSAIGTTDNTQFFNTQEYEKNSLTKVGHGELLSSDSILKTLENIFTSHTDSIAYMSSTMPIGDLIPALKMRKDKESNKKITSETATSTCYITDTDSDC